MIGNHVVTSLTKEIPIVKLRGFLAR
jgi:hypothetical protein